MDVKTRFEAAVAASRSLQEQSNEALLELYSLYKQATQGDATGDAPGLFDPVGNAKFMAWKGKTGMSEEDAMVAYADLVEELGV